MKSLTETELIERFHDRLDEIAPEIQVLGYWMSPASILKEIDPIAYHQEYLHWLDNQISDDIIIEKDDLYFEGE